MSYKNNENILLKSIKKCKKVFIYSFIFSFFINILVLFMPIYTSQVLDRVISSGSISTMFVLFTITFFSIIISCILESCRSIVSIKTTEWLDYNISPDLIRKSLFHKTKNPKTSVGEVLRDFSIIKNFLTSHSLFSIMDLPWTVIYISVLFMIHKYMGFLAIVSILILSIMAFLNNRLSYKLLKKNNINSIKNINSIENISRNFEVLEGMGMVENVVSFWKQKNNISIVNSSQSSVFSSIMLSITKFIRSNIQIIVISLGAYLTITQGKSCGSIIASSILIGRSVSPFDSAINSLTVFSNVKQSLNRINKVINNSPSREQNVHSKQIKGLIEIKNLTYIHDKRDTPSLDKINLLVNVGSSVGVIGESGSGKSTLSKILVGIYNPNYGLITVDGHGIYSYDRSFFGKNVGYLPQNIELFNTTIKHNIARLEMDIDLDKVKKAAKIVGIEKMIESLPNGYDTIIGNGGIDLSGGQKQLIGIARCFYHDIKLLVFDEPNASLDAISDILFKNVLIYAKQNNITTFLMTHKKSVLENVDAVITLKKGQIINIEKKIHKNNSYINADKVLN